jgi:hypothetical protein
VSPTFRLRTGDKYGTVYLNEVVVVGDQIVSYEWSQYPRAFVVTLCGGVIVYAKPETYASASCGVRALVNYFGDAVTLRSVEQWAEFQRGFDEAERVKHSKPSRIWTLIEKVFG